MKKNVPFIITSESITIVVGGKPYTINHTNPIFDEVKQRIANQDFANIVSLLDSTVAISKFAKGNIEVKGNSVYYKGAVVHNHVVERILSFIKDGLPHQPLVAFLDKLLSNPSRRAVEELYRFLEHKNMPLTPDGNFLAYKSVRSDWTDHHTGKVPNTIGSVIEMPRNQVCDNANIGCSVGFHAGSLAYAQSFGGAGSILLIVEINPADVVSIPHDCDCQKLRTSKYKVVGTFERALTEPLVNQYANGGAADDGVKYDTDGGDSYKEGYAAGKQDAELGLIRNSDEALSDVQDGTFNDASFIEGYNDGYDNSYVEPSTKEKLSLKAQAQKRDSSGRFTAKPQPKRDGNGRFC